MSPITRDAVNKDAAELIAIRQSQGKRDLSADEKHQIERDVCKMADRAERRAKGET